MTGDKSNKENEHQARTYIDILIDGLHDENGWQRQKARLALVHIGRPAVPALIAALRDANSHARWQAAEALAEIHDPTAAEELVHALKDEDLGVRWAASRALIALDRAALPALLRALMVDFASPRLRQGAHHILHTLKYAGHLRPEEVRLFNMLHDTFPDTIGLPWQAKEALEAIGRIVAEAPPKGEN
jgi:HEAT repeat protein